MQKQKDEVKERIINAARKEFQEKGFEKASIRNIASGAEVSKSNIYNYYNNKEALFEGVVSGTIYEIQQGFNDLMGSYGPDSRESYSLDSQEQIMGVFMKFVFTHSEDLKLLLFKSQGTKLFGFKKNITEGLSKIFQIWLRAEMPHQEVPPFFIYSVAGFYIDTIEKIVDQDLTPEEVFGFSEYFLKFLYGGWESIFQSSIKEE